MSVSQQQLIELIQQHFPEKREPEILAMLVQCQDELITNAGGLNRADTGIETVGGTRFYELDSDIIEVERVELEDSEGTYKSISKLSYIPGSEATSGT